ncbi:MAG: hypothetical protein GY930_03735 [bacterium]|nr:hypothetical protein [bacterium]
MACKPIKPEPDLESAAESIASSFTGTSTSDEQLGDFHVSLQISIDGEDAGTMTLRLWPHIAPKTVRNFLTITSSGFYDGLTVHRILRGFMAQAGCENGRGDGVGPLPAIPGEFSNAEEARHVYGTLSMARSSDPDSAGAQFFVICNDGPPAWSLDGAYASFGQVVDGEKTLEAIAAVPVARNPEGEVSVPLKSVVIVKASVLGGGLSDAKPVVAPAREQDSIGWPNTVEVQTLLIAVSGGMLPSENTLAQAEQRAGELLLLAQEDGADFDALVREHSDDPVQKGAQEPVGYMFANEGSHPKQGQREVYDQGHDFQMKLGELGKAYQEGTLTAQQHEFQEHALQVKFGRIVRSKTFIPRSQRQALADRAFEMKVGQVRLIPRDPARTLEGFYLMKRLR